MSANPRAEGANRPSRSSSSSGSAAHYALCALGVGLLALGIIMIAWSMIPRDPQSSGTSGPASGNSTGTANNGGQSSSPSIVAFALVGFGAVILFFSICMGVRNKRAQRRSNQPDALQTVFMGHVTEDEESTVNPNTYNVPSYDEVVGSNDYPVRQSNLQRNTSNLPSYEDIIAAVENDGTAPPNNSELSPLNGTTAAHSAAENQPEHAGLKPNSSLPTRSSSRASRLLRPLRVRRIKSDKLHLKDIRLQIRTPTQNPVTIEPITPPPQYDNEMPELQ